MLFIASVKIIICYDNAILDLQMHSLNANVRYLYDGEFPGMFVTIGNTETGWDLVIYNRHFLLSSFTTPKWKKSPGRWRLWRL